MNTAVKHRDFFFDTLKGFLILFVIIGNSLELASPKSVNTHYFILFLYMFHMPMFTFVSGYFSKLSSRTTIEKVKYTFKLYIVAQFFYIIFYKYILGNEGYAFEFMHSQWTLWYLLSLTCWYVLSDYVTNKKKWLIGSILLALLVGFDNSIGSYGSLSRTIFFFPFFIMGMSFDKKYIDVIKKHKFKLMIGSCIILFVLYLLSNKIEIELLFEFEPYSNFSDNLMFPLLIRCFHYFGSIILGSFILCLIPNGKTIISPIGRNSLILYLIHGAVSYILIGYGYTKYDNVVTLVISELLIVLVTITLSQLYINLKFFINTKKTKLL
ncbi:acyltransferase family protein [Clostridium sp. Ade.TY]|uniref:acyltransferase family protein n=1 Tax=Clostridium sp. Ade.TY TaxID=1391647 RepID=UPI0004183DAC|nr:acyltransferase family protein [Clostridium sp. Ade.TY]